MRASSPRKQFLLEGAIPDDKEVESMKAYRLLAIDCIQCRIIVIFVLMMMFFACGEGVVSVSSLSANDASDSSSNDATLIDASLLDVCENCLSDMSGNLDDAPDDDPDGQIDFETLDETDAHIPSLDVDASTSVCSNSCDIIGEQKCVENGIATCIKDEIYQCLIWDFSIACNENQICDEKKVACVDACGDYCEQFSLILLPDTQYYTQEPAGSENVYNKQLQWVADNKEEENIKFVAHLGDITNNNVVSQWEVASQAHEILDKAQVPYSMITGNHDYIGTTPARTNTYFGEYFGKERYAGKNWYGGSYATVNNYAFFEVGHMKFMVLSLEYAPRKETLCWAERLIQKYPDRYVIVATHCYLTHDAKYGGSCPKLPYATNGSRGTDLWKEFISQHSNIFLVACGHVGDSEYRQRTGNSGNKVNEMLVDYQYEKRCTYSSAKDCVNHCKGASGSGNGWLRQLIFDPKTNTVTARTLSVLEGSSSTFPKGESEFFCSEYNEDGRQWYPSDPMDVAHQYSFVFNMNAPPDYKHDDGKYIGFNSRVINSTGSGQQYNPEIAVASDGGFIAVWEDDSSSEDGLDSRDIFAKGFLSGGCSSDLKEFVIHQETSGDQRHPDIAIDDKGDFVIVWEDDKDGNGYYEVFMRGFFADGSEKFSRKKVNTVSSNQQFHPKISMMPDGRFVVVWEDYSSGRQTPQILMRGFNADGSQRFPDRNVMDTVEGSRLKPDLFLDGNANVVVTWEDDTGADGYFQIFAKGFNPDGTDRFSKIVVNSKSSGQQRSPSIHGTPTGEFVVVWEDDQDKDGKYTIMARAFDSEGRQRIADMIISAGDGNDTEPAICVLEDGAFTVLWTTDNDSNGNTDLYWRHYSALGDGGDAQRVNYIQDGVQHRGALGCTKNKNGIVLWEDDNDGNGYSEIYGRGMSL